MISEYPIIIMDNDKTVLPSIIHTFCDDVVWNFLATMK
jgi:hypothetical protein